MDEQHDRSMFNCGNDDLNKFLKEQALQALKKEASKTRVVVDAPKVDIQAFSTLTNCRVDNKDNHLEKIKKGAHFAILLGRLGTDVKFQKQGCARLLIVDALQRTSMVSEAIGCIGLLVHSKADSVKFYEKLGFQIVEEETRTMFMSIGTIRAAIAKA